MLDGHTYRLSEALARRKLPNWHLAQFHSVCFDNGPFPQETYGVSELWQLMDTMQETRFEGYMQSFNGLLASELNLLVDAMTDLVIFQRTFMPDVPVRLPYSTLMSALAVYQKLRRYHPSFKTILEIGPGCGYNSLFLKRHTELTNYTQIEACQAFYLLQNALNCFSFPGRFEEKAFPELAAGATNAFTTDRAFIEALDTLSDEYAPKCTHVPWWRLGDIAHGTAKFDVVTTNATLCEMKAEAFTDYLEIISRVLAPDGVVICQCLGGEVTMPLEHLRDRLFDAGYAPLTYIDRGGKKFMSDPLTGESFEMFSPVGLGVFVRGGHPLFEKNYVRANFDRDFVAADESVVRALHSPDPRRQYYRAVEIREMVKYRLEARFADELN